MAPEYAPLLKMSDGTIKQVNPFSGTQVWTIPGRANRPLTGVNTSPSPIDYNANDAHCAFCSQRVLETPPEKSRLVLKGGKPVMIDTPSIDTLSKNWDFRRIPNLFEILSFDYWVENYGYQLSPDKARARDAYLADPAGRTHLLRVLRAKHEAAGLHGWDELSDTDKLRGVDAFFGGCHDVIVGRRHFEDGATNDSQLAGSGTLSPAEHEAYFKITLEAMADLYKQNRYARYVQVFQNWLRPAGASFDHLHKQLVAIDQRPASSEQEVARLRENPNIFNELAVDYAGYHNLIIAENKHAVAFAGFGHRYPTLEVYSKSAESRPWAQSPEEQRAMSDLVHAMHVATGSNIATNEEWHHKPVDLDMPAPWRILIKWRVSTLAGFEGGTKIYVNTIDPWSLRDRVVPRLLEARAEGKIANMNIATECSCKVNSLKYNAALQVY